MMTPTFIFSLVLTFSFATHAAPGPQIKAQDWAQKWAQAWSENKVKSFDTLALEKALLSQSPDLAQKENLKTARTLFGKGQFAGALNKYNLIPRGNTYWLSAVEEKGWAYFQQSQFEKALAQTKTLLAPPFAEVVNSEAFFLQSLTQLKICDYRGVFETHQLFKEKQKARILEIQNLAQTGWNESLARTLRNIHNFPLTLDVVGEAVNHLPNDFYRDLEFQRQVLRFKTSAAVLALTEAGLNQVSETKITQLQKQLEQFQEQSFAAIKKRIKALAQIETDKNFKVIQKLNLVEVEAIQRLHTDLDNPEELYQKNKFKKVTADQLVFMDDGKPWMDELDKYEVAAKICLPGIRRKM